MASIYDLKPKFQGLLRPLTNALARGGVTANQVTLAAMLLSLAVGAAVALRPSAGVLLLVPLTLFLRMALNAIDGMLAREHGQKSRLGAVLNELGDVVSDAGLDLPFARVLAGEAALVVGIVLVAVIGEMTGVVGLQVGASRRYDGPMGKSDRAFWVGLLALLLGLGVAAGAWVRWYLAVVLLLGVVTILNRARGALREGA